MGFETEKARRAEEFGDQLHDAPRAECEAHSQNNSTEGDVSDGPTTALRVFDNAEFGQLRTVVTGDGQPWFVLVDACRALELSNPSVAAKRLDSDERAKFNLGHGDAWCVSFSGLLALVLRSKKQSAQEYQRWVRKVVLPSIHTTGAYVAGSKHASGSLTAAIAERVFEEMRDVAGSMSFTQAWHHILPYASEMQRKELVQLFVGKGFVSRDGKQPTALGIRKGLVVQAPISYHERSDGTRRMNEPYVHVTVKGLAWACDELFSENILGLPKGAYSSGIPALPEEPE